MPRSDKQQKQADNANVRDNGGSGRSAFAVLGIYAGKAHHLPVQYHLLIIFGCIFVLLMLVGDRDPRSVAIMSSTVLAAYLVVFLLNERKDRGDLMRLREVADRLNHFLGLSGRHDEVRFYIPAVEAEHHPSKDVSYKVNSLALDDVRAVVEILSSLVGYEIVRDTHRINPSRLFIKDDVVPEFRSGALFLIGGPLSNRFIRPLIKANPYIDFEDWEDEIGVVLKDDRSRKFTMKPPRKGRTLEAAFMEATYGCVIKAVEKNVTRFAIWGLDARGTRGAAHWLTNNWSNLEHDFKIGPLESFTAVLRLGAEKVLDADRPRREAGKALLLPVH